MTLWCEVKHTHENSNRIQLLADKNSLKWGRTSFLSKQVILSDNRCINRATIHQYINCSSLIRILNIIWFIAWENKIILRMRKRKISKRMQLQAPPELYLDLKSHTRKMNPEIQCSFCRDRKKWVFLIYKFDLMNWKDKNFILMITS